MEIVIILQIYIESVNARLQIPKLLLKLFFEI